MRAFFCAFTAVPSGKVKVTSQNLSSLTSGCKLHKSELWDWSTCFHSFWLKESCSKWFSAPLPLSRSLNLTGLPEKFLSTSIINRCILIFAWEEADLGAFLDHREVQDHSGNPWQIPASLVLVVKVNVLNLRHLHCINIIPNVVWTRIKAEFPYILWPW